MRSATCESACCAWRGFPSPRYFPISSSLRDLPNHVQYHVRKGTTTKRTATTASGHGVRLRPTTPSFFVCCALIVLLRAVKVVEHEVDEDARDGDVDPQ